MPRQKSTKEQLQTEPICYSNAQRLLEIHVELQEQNLVNQYAYVKRVLQPVKKTHSRTLTRSLTCQFSKINAIAAGIPACNSEQIV